MATPPAGIPPRLAAAASAAALQVADRKQYLQNFVSQTAAAASATGTTVNTAQNHHHAVVAAPPPRALPPHGFMLAQSVPASIRDSSSASPPPTGGGGSLEIGVHATHKDILFGRGRSVFNHPGNIFFRGVIDLFVDQYVECNSRAGKTAIVKGVLHHIKHQGFRFLRKDDMHRHWCVLNDKHALQKIGHALRDRTPLAKSSKNERKRVERRILQQSQLDDSLLSDDEDSVLAIPDGPVESASNKPMDLDSDADDPSSTITSPSTAAPAATSGTQAPATLTAAAGVAEVVDLTGKDRTQQRQPQHTHQQNPPKQHHRPNHHQQLHQQLQQRAHQISQQMSHQRPHQMPHQQARQQPQPPLKKKRFYHMINDIVVPCMKHGELPYRGHWKFFPYPGNKDEIDLGENPSGWKLKLEPISFQGEPIFLDVKTAYSNSGASAATNNGPR